MPTQLKRKYAHGTSFIDSIMPIPERDALVESLTAAAENPSSYNQELLNEAVIKLLTYIKRSPTNLWSLYDWLSVIRSSGEVRLIKARDATEEAIIELFDLTLDKSNVWILAEKNLLEVPLLLIRNLNDLKYALYADSEATCRMAIDIILVQCRKYLRQKCEADNAANNNGVQPSTSAGVTRNSPPRADRINKVKLIPETSLSVDIYSDSFPGIKYRITGRADWTFGYKDNGLKDDISKDDERTLFVAIEAKQRSEFSNGETQLITYLAILRENRLRAKKRNVRTQGFYSDGERFAFISISQDGIIQKSRIFDITEDDDLKIVYNFITTMMETALKSSPTSSPTKQGEKQEEEINCYHDEVWLKAYALREKGKQRHD